MMQYEYKVIASPTKGLKAPGLKRQEDRFAHAIEVMINDLAAEGWQYLRADLLPSEERQGLASSQTVYRTLLVFRRDASRESAEATPISTPAATPVAEFQPVPERKIPVLTRTDMDTPEGP